MRCLFLLFFLISGLYASAQVKPVLSLEVFSTGYSNPLAVRNDGVHSWLYIVQQNGMIYIADTSGSKRPTPFLNITGKVLSGGERGLLGLAFHPDFRENRLFVVNYTRQTDGATVIATYKATEGDPFTANAASEKILLTVEQPFSNHNGGEIHFAADGYLYIGMGDGGSGGDPRNNAQNPMSYLGKILRIHVNTDSTYTIPEDNPFVSRENYLKEIWAMGLRNPWRFSFDRQTDDLWIADVGQSAREEVNLARSVRKGGENYGWRCYEGEQGYNTAGCEPASAYVSPLFTYNRTNATGGQSITGGYVYRGNKFPDLQGYYVCADYVSRNFWLLKMGEGGLEVILKNNVLASVTSFGEDLQGELYLTSFNGNIYRVGSLCSELAVDSVYNKSASCKTASDGALYVELKGASEPVRYLWTGGDTTQSVTGLEGGWYYLEATDANGCVLREQFLVETLPVSMPEIQRNGDTLLTEAEGTYRWFLDGAVLDGEDQHYILPAQNGIYTVEVTDGLGCVVLSDPVEFIINSLWSNTRSDRLYVYPNPAGSQININVPESVRMKNLFLTIFDVQGKVVAQRTIWSAADPVSLLPYARGVYFIEIEDPEGAYRAIAKIVKN